MTDIELCKQMFDRSMEKQRRLDKRKLHRKLQGYEFKPEHQREIKRNQITFPARYNPWRGTI